MQHQRRVAAEQARGIDPLAEVALAGGCFFVVPEAAHRRRLTVRPSTSGERVLDEGVEVAGPWRVPSPEGRLYTGRVDLRDYYDEHWTHVPEGGVDYSRLQFVIDALEPGERVLDSGCGPGFSPRCCATTGAR